MYFTFLSNKHVLMDCSPTVLLRNFVNPSINTAKLGGFQVPLMQRHKLIMFVNGYQLSIYIMCVNSLHVNYSKKRFYRFVCLRCVVMRFIMDNLQLSNLFRPIPSRLNLHMLQTSVFTKRS